MNSFLYYISILNAHLPFHRKWGFMFWSLQHHLSTFIPFHPTVLDILELFQVFGCKCSFCFSPGLCRIAFPTFRTVSDVHLFTHSPQVWAQRSLSVVSTPETLSWPLESGLGLSFHVLLFHSLRLYPCDDLLMCVCVWPVLHGKVLTSTRWDFPLRWPPWSLLLATAPWSGGVYSFLTLDPDWF